MPGLCGTEVLPDPRDGLTTEAVRCLAGCEADGMKLENCPAYVREWIDKRKTLREGPTGTAVGFRFERAGNRGGEYIS
jgi:predicted metal-binding protein